MLKNCANPQCGKPLHYLREGRIFVFDAVGTEDGDARKAHRMEHFWLCGECSKMLMLEQTQTGVRVVNKGALHVRRAQEIAARAMAS